MSIHPEDPNNQKYLRLFEGKHNCHTLITLDIDEVKNQYKESIL